MTPMSTTRAQGRRPGPELLAIVMGAARNEVGVEQVAEWGRRFVQGVENDRG